MQKKDLYTLIFFAVILLILFNLSNFVMIVIAITQGDVSWMDIWLTIKELF